jgi:hypothetical protein
MSLPPCPENVLSWIQATRARVEKAGDALRVGNAGVKPKPRVNRIATRILGSGKAFRQRHNLITRQTGSGLRAVCKI